MCLVDSSGMPEYLDESDYDDEDSDNNERMTTWGCSSLEERLERQRQEEVRFLRAVARFITTCVLIPTLYGTIATTREEL